MSFSRGQQPELRLYLTLAWKEHCRAEGLDPQGRCRGSKRCGECEYCGWYEGVLKGATGKTSSTRCNAGRDYDFLMRDLEIIHGQSIKWQRKAQTGDAKRIAYELREAVGEHGIEEDYLRGVARRMLGVEVLPPLEEMARDELLIIMGEVKRYVRRRLKQGLPARPASDDPDWFV